MKTVLVLDATTALGSSVCVELSKSGHRLLMLGPDAEALTELDASLSQSELHRFVALDAQLLASPPADQLPSRVACRITEWLSEEQLELGSVVLSLKVSDPPKTSLEWLATLLADPLPGCSVAVVIHVSDAGTMQPTSNGCAKQSTDEAERRVEWNAALNELRVKLEPRGIRVNAVFVSQLLTQGRREAAEVESQRRAIPTEAILTEWALSVSLRRLPEPASVAKVISYLLSCDPVDVTGAVITVGGPAG